MASIMDFILILSILSVTIAAPPPLLSTITIDDDFVINEFTTVNSMITTTEDSTENSIETTTDSYPPDHFAYLNECDCGRRKLTRRPKIINGTNAIHGDNPWMISLLLNNRHHCGGSLINPRWILTAAHCVYQVPSSRFKVKLGSYYRQSNGQMSRRNSVSTSTTTTVTPEEPMSQAIENVLAIPHPGFTFATFQDDLALIRLPSAINFNEYIAPICLPVDTPSTYGSTSDLQRKATVIGWGKLQQGGKSADTLQQVTLPIIDNQQCISWYREMGKMLTIRPTQICAGFERGGKDACQGDSGSPMIIENDQQKQLPHRATIIGIVSAGIGCALPKLPGIYTRVSAYLPWIAETINKFDQIYEQQQQPSQKPTQTDSTINDSNTVTTIEMENTDVHMTTVSTSNTDDLIETEHDNLWSLVSPPPAQKSQTDQKAIDVR